VSNQDTMQRFYDELNAGNIGVVDEVLADDFVEHDEFPGIEQTKDGVRQFFEMSRAAFPDMSIRVLHIVGEGDVAIAHATFEGTHEGDFMGIAGTGRRVSVPMADVVRFGADGRAVEHWGVTDTGMMMMQLGVVPEPAA
jgi:steroid delta-isomerase-like uncharacterized protein